MSQEKGWKRESGFIWSVLGSAIGFANILSFSAQCYRSGGGAFLIPLFIAYLLLGLPLLIVEAIIGQKSGLPLVGAYKHYVGKFAAIPAWVSLFTCLTIGAFYAVLTGYTLAYTYFSLTNAIPTDTAIFFREFLKDSGSLNSMKEISWPILLSAWLVIFASWRVLTRNIQAGIERVCSFFMPLLVVMLALFALVALFLPGAWLGVHKFIQPDFTKLCEFSIWRDAFGHLFFSLSLGLGIVTGYARYSGENVQVGRAMRFVILGDIAISTVAGLVIFACLGYLSHETGVVFDKMICSCSTFELGFIIFPKVLQAMGFYATPIFGTLFFFSLFIAGITGLFSIAESVIGNLQIEFSLTRFQAATITSIALLMGSSCFSASNGQHIIGALSPMVLGDVMLFSGFIEVVTYFFIVPSICRELTKQLGFSSSYPTKVIGIAICAILLSIFIGALQEDRTEGLSLIVRWGWLFSTIVLAVILSYKPPKTSNSTAISPEEKR